MLILIIVSLYETTAKITKDPIVGLVQLAALDDSAEKFTAIIGCAMDDHGKLIVPDVVNEVAKDLLKDGIDMSYAPSSGVKGLAELMANEVLGKNVQIELESLGLAKAQVVTCAGTNAISTALMSCTSTDDEIITHNPHWAGYDSIALALKRKPLVNFEILDEDDNFNAAAFADTVAQVAAKNPKAKLNIVINTPFDNPLGKDFGDKAWDQIGDVLSGYNDREILLILDTAYIDFGPGGKDYKRLGFLTKLFQTVKNPSFNLVIAATVSKSFAMYGARVGVSILITSNKESAKSWADVIGGTIRGTFSNANNFAQQIVKRILETPAKHAYIHDFQALTSKLLQQRTETFLKAFDSVGFDRFRYVKPDGGFFVSLKFDDLDYAQKFNEKMLEKHFYAPLISDQYLRIPVCGLNEEKLQICVGKLSLITKEL
jgi:aromatic-amino-acid transaminase